ncbi:Bug family tripartite tricarboxylate transporter substrate binding protein [Rhodoplanes sp. Z2-YC6860]|uniref:Bug family tripartite tricarboxylate transporter substrate binding protein n=1 Tax=Rhodoplanes sp. Z2-YC6860 TaxID=674703 RepID=UPI00078CEE3C|nr:tripartite tricarboxylate transporter substrate binding protein [Rhodoplanes sp. Z2-YC6860]AMN43263.1 extra-cytoplasmic solute receptor protein [Rhodoplanes sp. Z2-YC6860]
MVVRILIAALIACAALANNAQAQDWPTKPIRIVTGFAAGGIGDLGARLLAEHITRTTGQQAVVENRTGAAGTLGMDVVAKAPPDGTTLGLVLNGNLVINPFIQKQMPFDALRDLIPVAAIGEAPQMIALSTEVPAKTFKEFQALAKAKPGTYSYGSAGVGSLPHLSVAEFARLAGIELIHVPYRGNAPAMTDLIAGRIQLSSSSIGQFRGAIDAGKIRLLLTATKERLPYLPDVPSSAEAGLPGYLMSVWIGVVAPAGTPAPMLDRIHAVTQDMLKDQAARTAMSGAGLDPMVMSRAAFADFVKAEYVRWEGIVANAGVVKE